MNHGEALEADFFRFWHVDINTCDVRRMRNLYERLPAQSETNWDISEIPAEGRIWDVNTYMLANLLDAVKELDWHLVAANSKRPPRPPKPFKRPEIKKREPKKPIKQRWAGKTIVDRGNA